MSDQQEQGFAEKMQGMAGSFQWFMHLLSDQPFSSYKGDYPSGLKKNLTSLLQMAEALGFSENFEKDVIDSAVEDLTAKDIMKVLYDPDRVDAEGNPAPMISKESFTIIMGDLSAENNELLGSIVKANKGFFQTQIDNLTMGQALGIVGMGDMQKMLSMLERNDEDTLLDTPLSEINAENIARYTNEDYFSNRDMLNFLDQLPSSLPDGQAGITKKSVVDEIFTKVAEKTGFEEADLRKAVGTASVDFNDVSSVVNKLANVVSDMSTKTILGYEVYSEEASDIKAQILAGIRESIPAKIEGVINSQKDALLDEEGQLEIRKLLDKMKPEQIYEFLKTSLDTEKERQEFLQIISQEAILNNIKDKIKKADLGLLQLAQLMPDGQFDKKASEALRDALKQIGFFEPLKQIFDMFMDFIGPILQKWAPGLHDTLMGVEPEQEPSSENQQEFDKAAGGETQEQQQEDPAPEEEAHTHNGGTKNELGR